MKVTKSLLLGAAAGLVAMSGAQAADLPVKAKPVEYVKICSAYGAGFYYIPGTDICIRVGGYVYYELGVKGTNATANIGGTSTASLDGIHNHSYNYYNSRASVKVILDTRMNTAYGTLRTYAVFGPTNANHSTGAGLDAGFIQFAGFTWGYTNSFFSFAGPGYGIVASHHTDWSWLNVFAYTAQFGNGISGSISVEDPAGRRADINGVIVPAVNAAGFTYTPGAGYGGRWMPDIVANLNVTQAWGRAQIMGAVHQVKPAATLVALAGPVDTEWGWAVGGGFEIKTPQTGNPNNSFILQGAWTEGAVDYTGYNASPTAGPAFFALQNFALTGPLHAVNDAVQLTATGELALTEAWSVYAAYRHYWTAMLRTAFTFGYLEINQADFVPGVTGQGSVEVIQANVSTVWSPVAGLDLSLDLVWSQVETSGNIAGGVPVVGRNSKNDIFTAWSRLRRNF
jgi:hypothetical protein